MNNLEEQAEKLRNEALQIISNLDLEKFLTKFGNVHVIGSVMLNLMTWRDIDIHVFCSLEPIKEQSSEVSRYVFSNDGVRKVTMIDYADHRISKNISNKPVGQYLGVEYVDKEDNKWKIDIWLFGKEKEKDEVNITDRITPERRRHILEIKNHYHSHPKYRNQFTSVDIYNAVLDSGITSPEQFETYLKEKDIAL